MKKKLAIMLLTVMAVSLVACGSQDDTNTNDNVNNETNVESTEEATDEVQSEVTNEGDVTVDENMGTEGATALNVIETFWPGFLAEMEVVFGGPADGYFGYTTYEKTTAEDMDAMIAFPVSEYDKVGDVAYAMHMMNANNLTAVVCNLNNAEDAQTVADAIKDNVMNRQWICGFPEKVIVYSFDGGVFYAFGNGQAIDGLSTSFAAAYENATLLYEENL